jgi:hypothetical protein
MIEDAAPGPSGEAGRSIGALDLLQVCILSGWDIPPYIAGQTLGFSGKGQHLYSLTIQVKYRTALR